MLKKTSDSMDIIFEAEEDLFNQNKSSIVLLKGSSIRIPITKSRNF